jgi:hypothetical protein
MNPALILAILLVSLVACKRQAPAAAVAAAPTPQAVAPDATAAPAAPAQKVSIVLPNEQTVIPDAGNVDANLAALSAQLRSFMIGIRGAPSDWNDFVTRGRVTAPPPPTGKKYAIQKGKVVLVNE